MKREREGRRRAIVEGVGEILRRHIRRIRKEKRLTEREIAVRYGIPKSSYSSIETGAYRITLDNLQRILVALGVDISDVWPANWEHKGLASEPTALPDLDRINAFRFRELYVHSGAESACLLARKGTRVKALSCINMAEEERKLLVDVVLGHVALPNWTVLSRTEDRLSMYLCLKDAILPDFLEKLAHLYLLHWLLSQKI